MLTSGNAHIATFWCPPDETRRWRRLYGKSRMEKFKKK